MNRIPNERGFLRDLAAMGKKRLVWMLPLMLLLIVFSWYLHSDPLADLKRTEETAMPEEAAEVIGKALSDIGEHRYRELSRMMRTKDSTEFEANYYPDGIFRRELPEFAPARVEGPPKRLVVSSWENLCVRLHSEPRDEDYLMSLVRIDGRWRISEIIPARLCGSL